MARRLPLHAARFLIFAAVGVVGVFVVMALLGILVRHAGPTIDSGPSTTGP